MRSTHRTERTLRDEASGAFRKKVLRRTDEWPFDRFSVIEPIWADYTIVCVGGGPSLTTDQCDRVREARERGSVRCITINNSYLLTPWADILYFADSRWWQWHKERDEFKAFAGLKCSIENSGYHVDDPEIHMLRNDDTSSERGGLSGSRNGLRTGINSGYQALGLAIKCGPPKKIVLLGYDMKFGGGRSHWHGGHPIKVGEELYRDLYRKFFDTLPKTGVPPIINASTDTAIKCFPRMTIEEALQ